LPVAILYLSIKNKMPAGKIRLLRGRLASIVRVVVLKDVVQKNQLSVQVS
jgi:hypothetical protein